MHHAFCLNRTSAVTRREALRSLSAGFGYLAFQSLAAAATSSLASKQPHFAPKAKRVIFLCMRGGPSHLDTFDYKPRLIADAGKPSRYAGSQLMPSLWEFKQRGQSGLWISEAFPNVAQYADDLCLLRGMTCDQPSHARLLCRCTRACRSSCGHPSVRGRFMVLARKI